MSLSSVLAAILHKPARKNPRMTPAKSHARNHIGHLFLPLIENSLFVYLRADFSSSKVEYNQYPDEGNGKNRIACLLRFPKSGPRRAEAGTR
jgi:hypothetical protein